MPTADMAHFVLVHGAFHGGWCWRHVLPRLDALGHSAVAVDLPGHAPCDAPQPAVTLADYRAAVVAALTPGCVLVGHSLGGLSITMAGAACPEAIGKIVYLAAHVPQSGKSLSELRAKAVTPEIGRASERKDGLSRIVDFELANQVFYGDCGAEDRALARERLVPQALSIFEEVMQFEPPDVSRHYIICTRDRAVRPEYQRAVTADWPATNVHEMDSDHSPFFSDPDGLVAVLDAIARSKT